LRIIHGDIKPQNILLDSQNNMFIADYGTSKIANHDETFASGTLQVTLKYAPPELICDAIYSNKVK
jgi:serine/threonine protein kinase